MVSVLAEGVLQQGNPLRKRQVAHAEQDHASVGELVAENERAEVLVVGQENAPLANGDGQDVPILQRVRVVAPDDGDVVSLLLEEGGEAKGEAFVKQERHGAGCRATSGVALRVASSWTSVWA